MGLTFSTRWLVKILTLCFTYFYVVKQTLLACFLVPVAACHTPPHPTVLWLWLLLTSSAVLFLCLTFSVPAKCFLPLWPLVFSRFCVCKWSCIQRVSFHKCFSENCDFISTSHRRCNRCVIFTSVFYLLTINQVFARRRKRLWLFCVKQWGHCRILDRSCFTFHRINSFCLCWGLEGIMWTVPHVTLTFR